MTCRTFSLPFARNVTPAVAASYWWQSKREKAASRERRPYGDGHVQRATLSKEKNEVGLRHWEFCLAWVARLGEKRDELAEEDEAGPLTYFEELNLHPRIADVANDLFLDHYHWEAVFAASKALINYVKEKSGRHDLDGAQLIRTVFSKNNPVLAFNDLSDQTDQDEQEGMMHLFEGRHCWDKKPAGAFLS